MRITLITLLIACMFSASAQDKKSVTIGILADKMTKDAEKKIDQIKNGIVEVAGKQTQIVFKKVLENNFEVTSAKTNYQSLLNDDTDIILAFGMINPIMLYDETSFPKPIIVLGAVFRDFINVPEGQVKSGIDNITFQLAPYSLKHDLEIFKSLYNYKNIGIVIDKSSLDVLPIKKYLNDYFSGQDADFKLIALDDGQVLSDELGGVDAAYMVINSFMNETKFKNNIDVVNQEKLPSISAFGVQDVENGALLAYQADIDTSQFMRRIALNVEAIINGSNPATLPMAIDSGRSLSLNFNTANLIDFQLRFSMMGSVNIVEGKSQEYQPENAYSIQDVMFGVLKENLSIKAKEKNISISEQDVKTSKSSYYPYFDASVTGLYIDPEVNEKTEGLIPKSSSMGGFALQQLIYSEQATANIKIQKYLLAAQQEDFNADQLDAILNGSIAYLNTLILKTNFRIQNQNLQLTKENLKISEQNFEVGAAGKADVLRFRSQLAQNIQALIEADNSLTQSYNTLNELLNEPISGKIDIENAELSMDLFKSYNYQAMLELMDDPMSRTELITFFVEEAINNAPELKMIGYNQEAAQRSYKLYSYGRFVPTIGAMGTYSHVFSKQGISPSGTGGYPIPEGGTYYLGVNMSLPIYKQNQQKISKQSAVIQKEQLGIQKDEMSLAIEKGVNDIVFSLMNELANIEISKTNLGFAKESLELAQEGYNSGAIPVIQLLDAQNNLLQAQLANSTAQYNYLIVAMQLERTIAHFFLVSTEESNQAFIERATQYILNEN